jgi:serine/threonine-protein kinase RsbW
MTRWPAAPQQTRARCRRGLPDVPTPASPLPQDAAASDPAAPVVLAGDVALSGDTLDTNLPRLAFTKLAGDVRRLTEVRRRLGDWALAVGLPADDAEDLVCASYEALANAAEHAYPTGPWYIDLVAGCTADGRILVEVRDHGQWRPAQESEFPGLGLLVIERLADRAEIQRRPEGTAVLMQWRLPRPPSS